MSLADDHDRPARPGLTGEDCPPTSAILLEFNFSETYRPIDFGTSDPRELAMGLIEIVVSSTGKGSTAFDFAGGCPDGASLLYGWSGFEAWGVWSSGRRGALLLDLPCELSGGDRVTIRYQHLAFTPTITVELVLNGQSVGARLLNGEDLMIQVDSGCAIRAVLHDPNNVSLRASADPELSVVIVARTRSEPAVASVLAVAASRPSITYEIVLVENGPRAEMRSVRDYGISVLRTVTLPRPLPLGEALNIGVEESRGRFVLLLGDDTLVQAKCIDRLFAALAEGETVACGPLLLGPDGFAQNAISLATSDAAGSFEPRDHVAGDTDVMARNVDVLPADCLLLRKDDFVAAYGFQGRYQTERYAQIDFCRRLALRRGHTLRRIAEASAIGMRERSDDRHGGNPSPDAIAIDRETLSWRLRDPALLKAGLDAPRAETATSVATSADYALVIGSAANRDQDAVAIATASALSRLGLTRIFSSDRRSRLGFAAVARELALEPFAISVEPVSTMDGRALSAVVMTSDEFPPPLRAEDWPCGARKILYAARPRIIRDLPREEREDRLAALMQVDLVVTGSALARHDCFMVLRAYRGPAVAFDVIRPPLLFANGGETVKENLLFVVGELGTRDDAPDEGALLSCLAAFKAESGGRWAIMIALDGMSGFASDRFSRFREQAARAGISVLANPGLQAASALLKRAKIVISLHGSRDLFPEDSLSRSMLSVGVAAAIRAGCIPIVFDCSEEAEICEELGAGLRYRSMTELFERLRSAAKVAGTDGLPREVRDRAEPLGMAGFQARWADLLSPRRACASAPSAPRRHPPDTVEPTPAFFVIGMHRSGTSAMTRVLSLAGADLPSNLMVPLPDNPTGFWEPLDVVRLNDRILARGGALWDGLFAVGEVAAGHPHDADIAAARGVIRANYRHVNPIVLKDPRSSLTAALWREALTLEGYAPRCVIMIRHPTEVARSIHARNQLPIQAGLLLWAEYTLAACANTRFAPRVFVTYDDLLDGPETVLDHIGRELRVTFPRGSESRSGEIGGFLARNLRHHTVGATTGPASFMKVFDLHEGLTAHARGAGFPHRVVEETERWLADLRTLVGPTLTHYRGRAADPDAPG